MRRPLDPRVNPQNLTAGAREDLLGKRKFFAGGRTSRWVPASGSSASNGFTPSSDICVAPWEHSAHPSVYTSHTTGRYDFRLQPAAEYRGHPGWPTVGDQERGVLKSVICLLQKKSAAFLFSSEWRRCFTGSTRVGASAGLNDMYKRSLKNLSRRAVPPSVPRLDPGFRV